LPHVATSHDDDDDDDDDDDVPYAAHVRRDVVDSAAVAGHAPRQRSAMLNSAGTRSTPTTQPALSRHALMANAAVMYPDPMPTSSTRLPARSGWR